MKATILPKLPKSPVRELNKPLLHEASTSIKLDAAKYLPIYQSDDSACADLIVKTDSPIVMPHRNVAKIDCGFRLELQSGYQAEITIKEKWAAKGLAIPGSPQIFDATHKENVFFHVINCGREIINISDGEIVGQISLKPIWRFEWRIT
ncbi:MAG: hypothetical protein ACW99G_03185 [Candidatus Thorarchaeota archaeon]|jgi:dUTPase